MKFRYIFSQISKEKSIVHKLNVKCLVSSGLGSMGAFLYSV
jgi:hypothetical protein